MISKKAITRKVFFSKLGLFSVGLVGFIKAFKSGRGLKNPISRLSNRFKKPYGAIQNKDIC